MGIVMLSSAISGCSAGGPTRAAALPSAGTTTDPATDVLLAQQITLLAAGDGAAPDCTADLSRIPSLGSTSPAVWIGNIQGKDRVSTPEEVALCLSGFSPDEPVKVTVTAGNKQYEITAQPTPSELTYQHMEPSESLFNGQELAVHEQSGGVLQSEKWWFVPPSAAREDLAAAGKLAIQADQGSLTAQHSHPVELPTRADRLVVDNGSHRILIYGFQPGMRVPVGLYKADSQSDRASLVRQIGTVVMPRSRTVVFTVPSAVVNEAGGQEGSYCVTVPLPEQYNCPQP
ncbi:hypothetical protein [Streptomyces sp. NPDC058572]|uniref:hypothetical protein n=1 Tax=Streptomyces sp. NPDC058572 TaxID=3346546 RepID=UPI00365977CB